MVILANDQIEKSQQYWYCTYCYGPSKLRHFNTAILLISHIQLAVTSLYIVNLTSNFGYKFHWINVTLKIPRTSFNEIASRMCRAKLAVALAKVTFASFLAKAACTSDCK